MLGEVELSQNALKFSEMARTHFLIHTLVCPHTHVNPTQSGCPGTLLGGSVDLPRNVPKCIEIKNLKNIVICASPKHMCLALHMPRLCPPTRVSSPTCVSPHTCLQYRSKSLILLQKAACEHEERSLLILLLLLVWGVSIPLKALKALKFL